MCYKFLNKNGIIPSKKTRRYLPQNAIYTYLQNILLVEIPYLKSIQFKWNFSDMHWPCLTRTFLLFLQNQHVMRILYGGKLHVASCSYFPTILRHNLSVWSLKGSHWLLYKLIFKYFSSHCWQEWTEFCLCNIERGTYVKKKINLSNPHCCCT